jgi:RNA polymerase sigma-70 factor (ECF subfamily)
MLGYQMADPEATTLFIRQASPLLFRFLVLQCRNRAEAEDLLQDTWLRVHKARHTYRAGEPVLPWLFAIARHVRVDGFRRTVRVRSRELQLNSLPETGPADTGSTSSQPPDFQAMIACLPDSQREVLSMLKVSGMSLEEVARATASSVGSVKLKAHRAYEKLRAILQRPQSQYMGRRTR